MRTARIALLLLALALIPLVPTSALCDTLATGQTLYVSVYTHVYHGPKSRPFPLTCTLSIRSTELRRDLTVESVDFYNSHGKLVRSFTPASVVVRPMGTLEFNVHENDNDGGSGANFVIRWSAAEPINPPVVEAVMIGTSSNQGISFLTRAVEIQP